MNKVKKFLKNILISRNNQMIQNINKDYTKKQKRILVSYITTNYYLDTENEYISHTNIYECQQIIKTLSDLDFCIDLTFCNDKNSISIIKNKKYEYILGFGQVFYEACKINKDAVKIMYATENPPEFSLKAEMERIEYYNKRNRKKVGLNRSLLYYKPEHYKFINYCIALGEKELYNNKFPVKRIYPTGFINHKFKLNPKEDANKNFLWFGSKGAIHKGLDILVDIFNKRDDINLYICGLNEEEKKFINIQNKNIKDLGRIDVNSNEFCELANKCNYVILPSCSEATSTAVLTCMNHGLIPIVQKDIGFNEFENYCYILDDYKIEYINKRISEIFKIEKKELLKKREEILNFSRKNFNINNYAKNIEKIIFEILENK